MAEVTHEEIDALLDAAAAEEDVEGEETPGLDLEGGEEPASSEARLVQPYDFSRPHSVSRAFERTLRNIAETFAKVGSLSFTNHVRTNMVFTFQELKVNTFGETLGAMANPSCICVATMSPLKGVVVISLDAPLMFSLFTKVLGGPVEEAKQIRDFTAIEMTMAHKLIGRLLANFRSAAERVVSLEPTLTQIENNPHYLNVLSDGETVLNLQYAVALDELPGSVTFTLPLAAFEPVKQLFDPKESIELRNSAEKQRDRSRVGEALRGAEANLKVLFRTRQMPLQRLLDLKEDDVLHLGHAVHRPLTVEVEGKPMFEAAAGRISQRRAIRIVRRTEEQ